MNGFSISKKQRQVLNLIEDPTVIELLIGGSAGGAKTHSICLGITILAKKYPGIKIFVGRKTLKSLRQSTISTLLGKVHPILNIGEDDFHYSSQNQELLYKNGSMIIFGELDYVPSDPDFARIGSLEIDCAFIDEAGEITLEAKNAIKSRVGRGILTSEYGMPGKVILSCFPDYAKVLTPSGEKPIVSLKKGDYLISREGVPTQIVRTFSREVDESLISIKVSNLSSMDDLTANHPILCSTSKRSKTTHYENGKQVQDYHLTHDFKYRRADEVKVGDWLLVPRQHDILDYPQWIVPQSQGGRERYIKDPLNNSEFWWLVGYWLGDGWFAGNKKTGKTSIQFALDKKYPQIIERLCNAIKSLGRVPTFVDCGRQANILFTNKYLAKWLKDNFGEYSGGKHIPEWALRGKYSNYLIAGFLDSDGSIPSHSTIEFVSINDGLLRDIQRQMFNLGLVGSMKSRKVAETSIIEGRIVKNRPRYHLFYGEHFTQLAKKLIPSTKLEDVEERPLKYFRRTNCYIDEDNVYFKVKQIKSKHYKGTVYNFETTTHNYIANGLCHHNCNPSTNFLRQEYYDPFEKLGGGNFQKWEIGKMDIYGEERTVYRAFLRISAKDNPFLPQSYIDNLATLPDRERKRLLDGNWNYADDENSLFRSTLLDKAITFEIPKPFDGKFDKYIGVDVADHGKDKTIFSLIENGVLTNQKYCNVQMTWDENSELPLSRLMADELIEFAQRNGFTQREARHIAVECNGVGVGIRDMLKERGWYLTEYTATHKSRSEGYYQLMLDMDAGEVKILNTINGLDELRKELSAHTYEMNNQTPDVVKKEKIKQAIGHSPDEADSFMIANHVRNMIKNPQNDPHRNVNRISF